eukprot:m.335437 g.335437  ORF g.335437 m.335437 type:complete len:583 (+) comp20525_c0_seq5:173-1921(+)
MTTPRWRKMYWEGNRAVNPEFTTALFVMLCVCAVWPIHTGVLAQSTEQNVTTKTGPEVKLNTGFARSLQFSPTVAAMSSDTFLAAWTSYHTSLPVIMARVVRISANGTVTETHDEVDVSNGAGGGNWNPFVTVLDAHRAYIMWEHFDDSSDTDDDIMGRVVEVNDCGNMAFPTPNPHQISYATETDSTKSFIPLHAGSAAAVGNTFVVATWDASNGTNSTMVMARVVNVHPNGLVSLPHPSFTVNSDVTQQWWPHIIALDSATVLISWHRAERVEGMNDSVIGGQERYKMYGQRFSIDSSGHAAAQGEKFMVSANDNTTAIDGVSNYGATVAKLSDGRVVMAWFGYDSGRYDLWTRIVDVSNLPTLVGSSLLITSIPSQFYHLASLVAVDSNGFVVSWTTINASTPSPAHTFCQVVHVAPSGDQSLVQNAFNLSTGSAHAQDSVLATSDGMHMLAAWVATEEGSVRGRDLYAQLYAIDLTAAGFGTTRSESDSRSTTTWIIVGVAVGVLVLVLVAVVYARRRARTNDGDGPTRVPPPTAAPQEEGLRANESLGVVIHRHSQSHGDVVCNEVGDVYPKDAGIC